MSVLCETLLFLLQNAGNAFYAFKFFQKLTLPSCAFAVSLFPSSPTPKLLSSIENLIENPELLSFLAQFPALT